MKPISRALMSVTDKGGLLEFAQFLAKYQVEILSTGGTAKMLRDGGVKVVEVSDYTGFPEMLDGRVKTLHPKIHGGILGRRDLPAHLDQMNKHQIQPIDLVVVNLYQFEKTVAKPGCMLEDAIENIDIGGVTLIRAAAKNHERITLICDPADYTSILDEIRAGGISEKTRTQLAIKGFASTAHYDTAIHAYLKAQSEA